MSLDQSATIRRFKLQQIKDLEVILTGLLMKHDNFVNLTFWVWEI